MILAERGSTTLTTTLLAESSEIVQVYAAVSAVAFYEHAGPNGREKLCEWRSSTLLKSPAIAE